MMYILTHSTSDYINDSSRSDMAFFGTREEAFAEMEKQYKEKSRKMRKKTSKKGSDILEDNYAMVCDDDYTEKWNISENPDFFALQNVFTGKQYTVSGFTKNQKDGSRCELPAMTFFGINEAKIYLRTLYDTTLTTNGLGGFIKSDGMYACIYKQIDGQDGPEVIASFSIEEGNLLQSAITNDSSESAKEKTVEKSLYVFCCSCKSDSFRLNTFEPIPFVNLDDAKKYLTQEYHSQLKFRNSLDNKLTDDNGNPIPGGRMSNDGMSAKIWDTDFSCTPNKIACVLQFAIRKVDIVVPVKNLGKNGYPDKLSIVSIAKRNQQNGDLVPVQAFAFFDNDEAESYMLKTHRELCREFCVSNYDDDHENFGMVENYYRTATHESGAYVLKKVPYKSGDNIEVARLKLNVAAVIGDLNSKEDIANYTIHKISLRIAENRFAIKNTPKSSCDWGREAGYAMGTDSAYHEVISILKSLCFEEKGKTNE